MGEEEKQEPVKEGEVCDKCGQDTPKKQEDGD